MKRTTIGLVLVAGIAACGAGGVDKKAEAHVCGYLVPDVTDGVNTSLADLNGDGGPTVAAADISQTTKQIREDVSTLKSSDPIRVTGETFANLEDKFAAALISDGGFGNDLNGLDAAGKALQAPGDKLQTLCRAVTP